MKTVNVIVTGTSPLLINRFKENDEHQIAVKKEGQEGLRHASTAGRIDGLQR